MAFIKDLYDRPIAIDQDKANEQHYEVPTAFHKLCLGPRMKYSSCDWPTDKSSLGDAEDAILGSYCVAARLGRGLRGVGVEKGKEEETAGQVGKEGEGLKILDLGCGWGSLGLFLAEVRRPRHGQILVRVDGSITRWRRLRCCRTRGRRSCILRVSPRRRVSATSR